MVNAIITTLEVGWSDDTRSFGLTEKVHAEPFIEYMLDRLMTFPAAMLFHGQAFFPLSEIRQFPAKCLVYKIEIDFEQHCRTKLKLSTTLNLLAFFMRVQSTPFCHEFRGYPDRRGIDRKTASNSESCLSCAINLQCPKWIISPPED